MATSQRLRRPGQAAPAAAQPAPAAERPTAPQLYRKLALLSQMADRKAVAAFYRAAAITADNIRVYAPYGAVRAAVALGVPREVFVDANDLFEVLRLSPPAAFAATVDDNALHWQCGPARGHLALMDRDLIVPPPDFQGALSPLAGGLAAGLELGALACRHSAARLASREGVQLRNSNGRSYAYASDNASISMCALGPPLPLADGAVVTLKSEAAMLLAAFAERGGDAFIGCNDKAVYCLGDGLELQLNQLPPLPYLLNERIAPFLQHKVEVPLFREAVAAFLKRAAALAEIRQQTEVDIKIDNGRTALAFHEAAGSTEEFYVVENGPQVALPPVRIEARRLARALAHASHLVFDYAEKNILVLRGAGEFVFGISGRPR